MNPSERTCLNHWMLKEALEKLSITILQGSWNMKVKWIGMNMIVFKTNHMPCGLNVNTRHNQDIHDLQHYVYNIPCEFGRNVPDGTGRPLHMHLSEHLNNHKQRWMEIPKLAQHVYE